MVVRTSVCVCARMCVFSVEVVGGGICDAPMGVRRGSTRVSISKSIVYPRHRRRVRFSRKVVFGVFNVKRVVSRWGNQWRISSKKKKVVLERRIVNSVVSSCPRGARRITAVGVLDF